MIKQLAVCASLILVASSAQAQTMYRCGNSYSDKPCGPEAKMLNEPKNKPAPIQAPVPSPSLYVPKSAYTEKIEREIAENRRSSQERLRRLEEMFAEQKAFRDANPLPNEIASPKKVAKLKQLCEKWLREVPTWKDRDSVKIRAIERDRSTYESVNDNYQIVWQYRAILNAKNSYGGYVGEKPAYCFANKDETLVIGGRTE